jgi:hypothetical protein
MQMKSRGVALLAVVAAAVSSAAASAAQANGTTPITGCGQVVRQNAFLTRDLHCRGLPGVVVGASGITIDLKGFTLRGDRSAGRYGIDDLRGHDGVTIQDGALRNFDYGVVGFAADGLTLSGLNVSGNVGDGLFAAGAAIAVRASTALQNGGDGLYVLGASVDVRSSTASGNLGNGIYVSGSTAAIRSSSALGNAHHGIVVSGDAAVVEGNLAESNGVAAGLSGLGGLGLDVFGYSTPPVGTNVARGNDDSAQCRPASLC